MALTQITNSPTTGTGDISGNSSGRITLDTVNAATNLLFAGRGKPIGQPPGTISLAENGAGNVNGVVQYAYTEQDSSGETSLSAVASITVSSKKVRVTMPLPRRGTDRRKLYRTAGGGSTFKLVHDFGGGNGYFQTLWDDDTADGSLGATAPSADASGLYELQLNAGVKVIASHPDNLTGPADLTLLTSDPNTAGAFAMDVYGPIYTRTGNTAAISFASLKTGTTGYHIFCETLGLLDDGSSPVQKFFVDALGNTAITPSTLVDGGNNAFRSVSTFPATIAANRVANYISVTGAGSSSFQQQAVAIDQLAGYTGNNTAIGCIVQQFTANTGAAIGVHARNTGASGQNIAVSGVASGGTQNIGVWCGLNVVGDAQALSAALAGSNGNVAADIFRFKDDSTTVLTLRDGGFLNFASLTNGSINTGDFWRDSQNCFKTRVGGTNVQFPNVAATQTSSVTVANSASETTLVGTLVGTNALGANFFVAGKSVRVRARGVLSSTGNPNLTMKVKFGSTVILSTGAVAQVGTPSNVAWELCADITCRTTGASGTVIGQGFFVYGGTVVGLPATATVTVDTTAAQTVDVTEQWGTADSGNTITQTNFSIEALN